jgi:hypothetical protein
MLRVQASVDRLGPPLPCRGGVRHTESAFDALRTRQYRFTDDTVAFPPSEVAAFGRLFVRASGSEDGEEAGNSQ